MNVLVCIKRVPATAGQITLTADAQEIDTRYLGFTISPHEECAVEEAVRLMEKHGGMTAVLTLGEAPLEHDRRDVDCGDGGSEPTRHLNSRGPDAAANVERRLTLLHAGEVKEFLGRATATWMDYALT